MTIVEFKADLLDKLRVQREEAAAERQQVATAISALNAQVAALLGGQVPDDVISEVNAAFATTATAISGIYEPELPGTDDDDEKEDTGEAA